LLPGNPPNGTGHGVVSGGLEASVVEVVEGEEEVLVALAVARQAVVAPAAAGKENSINRNPPKPSNMR
jgi:hypothetical protein